MATPPAWTPASSHGEEATRFLTFRNLCVSLGKALALPDEDARALVFNNVRSIAEGTVGILNLLHHWGSSPGKEMIPALVGIYPKVIQSEINMMATSMLNLARLGFLFTAQSQIENGARNLARGLGTVDPSLGYYRLIQQIGAAVGLTTGQREALQVPAELRNSLHNNGVFHGYQGNDIVVTLNGCQFDFLHGQTVRCGSMSHYAAAFSGAIEAFFDLCRTPAVQAIQVPLMDHYAWDFLTSA